MATTQVKVIISAKDNASKVLGGLGRQMGSLSKSVNNLGSDFKTLGKIALVGAAGLTAFATKAAFSAARVEELTFALHAIAKANNISNEAADEAVKKLRSMNIEQKKALSITSMFMQGQLDLTDALKLANAAKDLAILGEMDSSEATERLTAAVLSQRAVNLRQFKIITTLDQIYEQYGETIGKTSDELTEQEKRQAFLNKILIESEKVAGTYDAAMQSVSKQFRSLTGRIIPEFIARIGEAFKPALKVVIDEINDSIKEMSKWMEENEDTIRRWGETFGKYAKITVKAIKGIVKFLVKNKKIVLGVLVAMGVAVGVLVTAFVIAHAAIIGVIALITVGVMAFAQVWENTVKGVKLWTGAIKQALSDVKTFFEIIIDVIRGFDPGALMDDEKWAKWKGIVNLFVGIRTAIEKALRSIGSAFFDFKERIGTGLVEMSESFTAWKEQAKKDIAELPEALAFLAGYLQTVAPIAWEDFKTGVGISLLETEDSIKAFVVQTKKNFDDFNAGLGITLLEMENNQKTFAENSKKAWEDFRTGVGISLLQLEDDMKARIEGMGKAWEEFKFGLQALLTTIEIAIDNFIKNIVPTWEQFTRGLGDAIDRLKEKVQGFIDSLKEAFRLGQETGRGEWGESRQTGGMVPGPIGAPVPILAHAGERIIPAGVSPGGGGGGEVNFHVNIGLYAGTETEKRNIARELYAALLQVARSQDKTVQALMGG